MGWFGAGFRERSKGGFQGSGLLGMPLGLLFLRDMTPPYGVTPEIVFSFWFPFNSHKRDGYQLKHQRSFWRVTCSWTPKEGALSLKKALAYPGVAPPITAPRGP